MGAWDELNNQYKKDEEQQTSRQTGTATVAKPNGWDELNASFQKKSATEQKPVETTVPQPAVPERPVLKAAPPQEQKSESIWQKALKAVLPRELEIKFGLTAPGVAEVMMQNEDARAVYLRNKKFEETLQKEGVPKDIREAPEKYIPADYKEPTSFFGNIKEGLAYGYYATIRPAIGYLAESLGRDFGTPELIQWGEKFGDEMIADLLKKPELLAPADQKAFFEGGATDPRYYARTIGETAPFVATILGATALAAFTKNPAIVKAVAFGSVAAVEKGNAYKQMLDAGVSPDKAATASTIYGGIAAYIENAFGFKPAQIVLGAEGKNLIVGNFKNFVFKELPKLSATYMKNALAEGGEEVAQQLTQNLITKWFDQSQGVWEGVFASFPAGVVGALPFGVSQIISDVGRAKLRENYQQAEQKANAGGATDEEAVKEFTAAKNEMSSFTSENAETVYDTAVPGLKDEVRNTIQVVPFPDGTFGFSYDINTTQNSFAAVLNPNEVESTREGAINRAKREVLSAIKNELKTVGDARGEVDVAYRAELERIQGEIKGLTGKEATVQETKAKADEQAQPAVIRHGSRVPVEQIAKEGFVLTKNSALGEAAYFSSSQETSDLYEGGEGQMIELDPSQFDLLRVTSLEQKDALIEQSGTKTLAEAVRKMGYDGFVYTHPDPKIGDTYGIVNKEKLNSAVREKYAPKTQKEQVKEAVKEGEKSIKEISEETKILEPNVRRILGVGAKEGVFERIGKGVYRIRKDGQDVAFIFPSDAVETLPQLAQDGFKADMVFLDIPYSTAAVRGGNRGVKYDLISVPQFKTVMDAVSQIVRDENTAVFYMFSQAKSGLKDMQKYTDTVLETGFKPVARGEYTKLQKDGITQVRNMRGDVIEPEGIILFTKNGMLPGMKYGLIRTDENGRNIVWEVDDVQISVNKPNDTTYVALWRDGKKIGEMTTRGETGKSGYLSIAQVEIKNPKDRSKGYGTKMYEALLYNLPAQYKGIQSVQPDVVNNRQVPAIYKKLGATFDGDVATVERPITDPNLNFKLVRPKGYQTEKPAEMVKALIEMSTQEGDVVLDPFAGSGVVPAEAVRAGRKAVAIEKNKEVAEKVTKPRVEAAVDDRDIMEIENADLTLPELKQKLAVAIEGKEDVELMQMIQKDIITRSFSEAGLPIEKIIRAKKDDGWYVYHPNAMRDTSYSYKTVAETGNEKTVERTKAPIFRDFVADDGFEDMLRMTVNEAQNRAGIKRTPTKKRRFGKADAEFDAFMAELNRAKKEYDEKYPTFEPRDFDIEKQQYLVVREGDYVIDRDGYVNKVTSGNDKYVENNTYSDAVNIGSARSQLFNTKGTADGLESTNQLRMATSDELKQVGLDPALAKPDVLIDEVIPPTIETPEKKKQPRFGKAKAKVEPEAATEVKVPDALEQSAQKSYGKSFLDLKKSERTKIFRFTNAKDTDIVVPNAIVAVRLFATPKHSLTPNNAHYTDLAFGGSREHIFTDAIILISDKQVADELNDAVMEKEKERQVKELTNSGVPHDEAEQTVEASIAQTKKEVKFPDWKQIIPSGEYEVITKTLGYVGKVNDYGGMGGEMVFQGKNEQIFLNADEYALIQKYFSDAEMRYYGDTKPIAFVLDGKTKAVIMPIRNEGVFPRSSAEAPAEPQEKQQRFGKPKETKPAAGAGEASGRGTPIGDYMQSGTESIGFYETAEGAEAAGLKPYNNFKLYEQVQGLIKKYAKSIGQGYLPRRALGVFYPSTKNIRINGMNDLSVASHEITHFLDTAYNITDQVMGILDYTEDGQPIYDKKTLKTRKELTDLYEEFYPGAKRTHKLRTRMREGFATLLQKYTEAPKTIAMKYPNLVKDFLTEGGQFYKPVMGEIIQDLKGIVKEYQGLSALDKINSRIVSGELNVNKNDWLNFWERAKTEIADNVFPIEKLARESKIDFTKDDPSLWVRQYNNINALIMNNMIGKRGYWGWRNNEFIKLYDFNWKTLSDQLADEKKLDEFRAFLVARREHFMYAELQQIEDNIKAFEILIERAQEIGADKMTDEQRSALARMKLEVRETIGRRDELKSILTNDGFTKEEVDEAYLKNANTFIEEVKMFDALVREDLNFLHDPAVQLVNDDEYGRLTEQQGYATFKRQFYDELTGNENEPPQALRFGNKKVSSLKARTGSQRPIVDPLYSSYANHAEITKKAMKQIVYNKMLNISTAFPDLFQRQQLQAVPDGKGRMLFPQENDTHIIMARENYKRVPILTDNLVKRTVDEVMTVENSTFFEQLWLGAARFFTKGTTGIFPGFAATNYAIDQVSATALTRNNYIPLYDPLTRMWKAVTDKEGQSYRYFEEYMVMGGERQTMVGWQDLTPNELQRKIRDEKNGILKVVDMLNKGIDILAIPSKYSEILTRATEYMKAREAGKPQVAAIEEAGRVTAPFHHIGRLGGRRFGRNLIKSIPFFNPGIQVLSQSFENLHNSKNRSRYLFVALAVTAANLGSMGLMLAFATDEQKKLLVDLEPEELAGYMWLPNPDGKTLIRIRVPENLNVLGALTTMIFAELTMDADYNIGDYLDAGTAWIPQQMNPLQPVQALLNWIPQIIKPVVHVAFNVRDFPEVRPLEGQSMQARTPGQRFNEATSPVAKKLGALLNLSPIKIDYLLTGYIGRVSGYLTGKPGIYNPFRGFSREYYFSSGRRVQEYYDLKDANDQKYHDYKNDTVQYSDDELDKILDLHNQTKQITKLLDTYRDLDIEKEPEFASELQNDILERIGELQ